MFYELIKVIDRYAGEEKINQLATVMKTVINIREESWSNESYELGIPNAVTKAFDKHRLNNDDEDLFYNIINKMLLSYWDEANSFCNFFLTFNKTTVTKKGKTMRTAVIYVKHPDGPVKYYLLDGDFTHLHNVYVNDGSGEEDHQQEVVEKFDQGKGNIESVTFSEFICVVKQGTSTIECGFYC